ncbi:hypothetical protein PUNSTDRAFT_53872 [Punctularia strigosozonata HHB-11173 SS5]|uniref:uncharacterized protein n=1 Tax=Punctularia strigosozonata (strain HHB-11173) TaxID=741275 RepID=UPI000441737D|nr:uncharacterized protein PUNSTDRAFT_53872 [Punctularia strigosozonata HHB-11173 SS5]EIN06412.1 hypothetical protein PUNSTDRAFT_53872 [Punctularia strigosozonata HHB-11173 SS5]
MGQPIPLVVFGPNPDSWLVCYGRRFTHTNVPASLIEMIQSGKLAPMSLEFVSLHLNGRSWVARNFATGDISWSNDVDPNIIDHLKGNNGKPKAQFVSFCGDGEGHFLKHVAAGGWDGTFPDNYPHKIFDLRKQFSDFDQGLRGIIFGSGGTHLYSLETGFSAELSGKADDPNHPLYKALSEQAALGSGWTVDLTSSICFYDPQYFLLRFRKGNTIQWKLSLPNNMQNALTELMRVAETPEERTELQKEELVIRQQQEAQAQLRLAVAQSQAVCNSLFH